jgi:hypothetical protein
MTKVKMIGICAGALVYTSLCLAEVPEEFRPQPVVQPTEKVNATGDKVQPSDKFPVSRAPLVNTAQRKPKLANPGQPTLRNSELVFNAGWEMIESPRLKDANGSALSKSGVDTREWYDATVPGTVLTTLVDQGVYPNPYFGLNNLLIPESLNKQDYWYRTEFVAPKNFAGRELTLQFNGINFYAEVYFNGAYLGHITGAFIRGGFDVTKLVKVGEANVIAVMVAPPPDPGLPQEQSIAFGPRECGGAMCLDSPTFVCSEGWNWIPAIRDRDTGLWQDVILRATGPVAIRNPQVTTTLPLPDTSRADVAIKAELHNATETVQQGTMRGSFEGVKFKQPVTLQPGETKIVSFEPANFPQLIVRHPRLWWPNGYGKPELYHLQLHFAPADANDSDDAAVQFGIREMSYEFGVKKPDGAMERVEFTPALVGHSDQSIIDSRRDTMVWGQENTPKRNAAIIARGGKPPTTPFHWGQNQETTVALRPGAENSPALKPIPDHGMGRFLVIKVNGRPIECLGGDWGMDDAMKRVSRERLEPYIRMEHDAHLNMIRNWAGQSTSEAFYDLCDEYGILVWNDFWMNTEGHDYRPADHALYLTNVADALKRFRNHPSIALWCAGNECVPPEDINEAMDQMVYEFDGTRYYQPNSRLVNLDNSGPWSNMPLLDYFTNLNRGFTTELGASGIPSVEVLRTMVPEADLWPYSDTWAYHDLHSKGPGGQPSTFERIATRFGEPKNVEDLSRKAQMLNYETYRATYEGFNSRLWDSCSGVIVWMSHPSWPSMIWQLYTWDYDPNASLFGAMKGAEPVHIQMNLPNCDVAVVNHRAESLKEVVAAATIYDLSGHAVQTRKATLDAAPDACTAALRLDWPATGAYLARLELRDKYGGLLSENLYWHARNESDLKQLDSMPRASLKGKWHVRRSGDHSVIEGKITNPGGAPALEVRLTLRDAGTGERVLPVYYDDNYFSLLPGESREFRIETRVVVGKPEVNLTGWNVVPATLR